MPGWIPRFIQSSVDRVRVIPHQEPSSVASPRARHVHCGETRTRGAFMPSQPAPAPMITDDEPVSLLDAYRVCEDIARTHYENFPVASRFIPAERRIALTAIYAFARQADDVADAAAPSADRLQALDLIEQAFLQALDGAPHGPVLTALADSVERHRLPVEPFLDLLAAFRMDARDATFATWDDLLGYCRRSANPVGRLVLALYRIEDPEALRASDLVCTAL